MNTGMIMNIIILIAFFLLHFATAFLLNYAFDTPQLWKNRDDIFIRPPSLDDLSDGFDYLSDMIFSPHQYSQFRKTQNEYTDKIIRISHHYFLLKSTIEKSIYNESGEEFLSWLILQISSLLLILNQINNVFEHTTIWLWRVLSILLCIAGCIVITWIYNKKFQVKSFQFARADLIDMHNKIKGENSFPVSEETDFNNFVLKHHYKYLTTINHDITLRYYVKRGLIYLSGFIYLFFFMRLPD